MRTSLAFLALVTSCVSTSTSTSTPKVFHPNLENTDKFGVICSVVGVTLSECNCLLNQIAKNYPSDPEFGAFLDRNFNNTTTEADKKNIEESVEYCFAPPAPAEKTPIPERGPKVRKGDK